MRYVFALLLIATMSHLHAAETEVPAIAQIAGIRIGADTVEAVERKLGHGRVVIGGHPNGGREWHCKPAEWSLYVDGFYYDAAGHRITDALLIEQLSPGTQDDTPVAKIPRQRMRFLGVVSLGMTRAAVLQAIGSRLPPPTATKNHLVWTEACVRWINHKHYQIKGWRAELRFTGDKLQAIFIEALYA
jgi:hypothetical protein